MIQGPYTVGQSLKTFQCRLRNGRGRKLWRGRSSSKTSSRRPRKKISRLNTAKNGIESKLNTASLAIDKLKGQLDAEERLIVTVAQPCQSFSYAFICTFPSYWVSLSMCSVIILMMVCSGGNEHAHIRCNCRDNFDVTCNTIKHVGRLSACGLYAVTCKYS